MQKRLQQVKRVFRRMSVREKLLTLLFILVMLFIWAGNLLNRSSVWNHSRTQAQADLTIQQHWLDRSDEYTVGLASALERVDPKKTYEGPQLSGQRNIDVGIGPDPEHPTGLAKAGAVENPVAQI
jgi:hypothetical protein